MAHFNKLSNGSTKKDYCFKKLREGVKILVSMESKSL